VENLSIHREYPGGREVTTTAARMAGEKKADEAEAATAAAAAAAEVPVEAVVATAGFKVIENRRRRIDLSPQRQICVARLSLGA